jgi:cellulose synthase/poly-beta-1,6-N-acetylglucosamine synthase-like glycosyltransferase
MMIRALSLLLDLLAIALALPGAIFLIECLLALLPRRRLGDAPLGTDGSPRAVRFAVLIPAHDEAAGIRDTLQPLVGEVAPHDRILVIADNCTDATASVARTIPSVEVVERVEPGRRGKGYALAFGLEHLATDPPDVVIVFDADCRVEAGSLRLLAQKAMGAHRPVQADYLLLPPPSPSPLAKVSAFAFLVRNRVRPLGLARVGMPCHLTGTGMAIPWDVMRMAPAYGATLVEDLVMGIDLANLGYPPQYTDEIHVVSVLPEAQNAARGQRRRWEHGQLDTSRSKAPKLIRDGLLKRRADLLTLGLDLLVPPLALLVGVLVSSLVITSASTVWLGTSSFAPSLLGALLVLMGATVLLVWVRFARHLIGPSNLLTIPLYLLWKIPVYLSFAIRGRQKTWERTERAPTGSALAPRSPAGEPTASTEGEAASTAASSPVKTLPGTPK